MKLPTLDQLFPEQWTVYEHPITDPLFVVGPPGSGKTSLAILRTMFLVNQGQTVVVVTRNRLLAALARHLGAGVAYRATTMNSLISKDHSDRFGSFAPQPRVPFQYDWPAINDRYAASNILPGYDQIVVDEGQNLPPLFFQWARRYGGNCLTVFADEHQATCDETSTLLDIATSGNLPSPIRLTTNHRNTPEIANVAEHFHASALLPPAVVERVGGGEKPRLVQVASWDDLATRVATRFRNRREAIGVIVRRKDEATSLHANLRARLDVADRVDCYTSDSNSGAEASIIVLNPGVTVMTSEAVIGLEFEAVFLVDLDRSLPCTSHADMRRMYMLCARARNMLMLVDGIPKLSANQLAALPDAATLER
jgi:superfamily I DNA/RNA helicase